MVAPSVGAVGSEVTCPVPLSARPTHIALPFAAKRNCPDCGETVGAGVGVGERFGGGVGVGEPFPPPVLAARLPEFALPQPCMAPARVTPSTKATGSHFNPI